MTADAPLTVILADDHYLVREGTKRLLEDSGEVRVLAAVETASALLDAVHDLHPDAVITDIRMPPGHHMEGIVAARTIRTRHPDVGVVVLSQHADEAYAFELLRDGTAGLAYLLKERVGELDQLAHALREVIAGRSVIDPLVVEAIVARQARRRQSPVQRLTPRERNVLSEMAQGKSNGAIAAALSLSSSAIEKHVNKIFTELGLTDEPTLNRRVTAVLAFLREGEVAEGEVDH